MGKEILKLLTVAVVVHAQITMPFYQEGCDEVHRSATFQAQRAKYHVCIEAIVVFGLKTQHVPTVFLF